MDTAAFIIIVLIRVLVPLMIPRWPLVGIVIALVVDAADQTILAAFGAEPANYQSYDKALDVYYLAIAYLSMLRNWTSAFAFGVGQALWYYRLIGVVAFEYTGERWLLLVFPNTFEYFFIAYEAVRMCWDPRRLTHRAIVGMAAFIWIFIKLPQEYWIHIAQLDFTDELENTWFAVAVAIGLVLLAVVVRAALSSAPTADWKPTLEVDQTRTTVLFRPAELMPRVIELINHPLTEKTILTGLVVAIFSRVFDVDATVRQLVVGCGFIVVVNSLLSDTFRRRGVSWRNSVSEFLILLVLNWGAMLVYVALRPQLDLEIQTEPTVTMLGLLTLIIILYDRFRNLRLANTEPPERDIRERDS